MKVWVTKYALSDGIKVFEEARQVDDNMVDVPWPGGLNNRNYFHTPYWHTNEISARQHACKMRDKKIISLRKQIAKVEKLTF